MITPEARMARLRERLKESWKCPDYRRVVVAVLQDTSRWYDVKDYSHAALPRLLSCRHANMYYGAQLGDTVLCLQCRESGMEDTMRELSELKRKQKEVP